MNIPSLAVYALGSALLLGLSAPHAQAATFTVTSKADSGVGTLRQALLSANVTSGSHVIRFALPSGPQTIDLTTASNGESALVLSRNVTISGPGASLLTVRRSTALGTPRFRVFEVSNGASAAIAGLTISNGSTAKGANLGAGIYNLGTLLVKNCVVSGNSVSGVPTGNPNMGGGICNLGDLTLQNSTLSGNLATRGAGLANFSTALVSNCTFSGNQLAAEASDFYAMRGGGIFNCARSLLVTNSTFSGNGIAPTIPSYLLSQGGGICNAPNYDLPPTVVTSAIVNNCTFSGNAASANKGGSIYSEISPLTLKNSILNDLQGGTIYGSGITDAGYNLARDSGNRVLTASTNKLNTDPKMGPLQNNGGITFTHALLLGSPAIDKANTSLATDQRGTARPQGLGDDMGAYELFQNLAPTLGSLTGPNGSVAKASNTTPQTTSPLLAGQSAANSYVTFTSVVRDSNGNADLGNISFILGSGTSELRLTYNAQKNLLSVSGPSGASQSFSPGSANVLAVSSGTLDCAGTKVVRSGNDLSVTWRLKITTTTTAKQNLQLRAQDKSGALSALLGFGTWTFSPVPKSSSFSASGAVY